MNIYDVSRKAGVSIATVSRVLNGNKNVSDKTKQKVLGVMEEVGYTPNIFARGLGLNTMKTIGIMCTVPSDPFLSNSVYYIEQELRKNGYDALLCCTGYELSNKKKSLNLLLSKHTDAVILIGSNLLEKNKADNDYIINASEKVPVMMINGYLKSSNIYCTICDDYQAIYDATTLMLEHGKHNIVYLYNSKSYSGMQKIKGYKTAFRDMQIAVDDTYILRSTGSVTDTKELLLSFSNSGHPVDAVIAAEDILAVGAIKYAKEKGLSIPEDVSILGYNNSLLAICCEPELSTIDNHVEILSVATVHNLMRVLHGQSVPGKTMLSNDLIQRKTTNFKNLKIAEGLIH